MKALFFSLIIVLFSSTAYALTLVAQAPTLAKGHIRLYLEPCESQVFSGHQYIIYDAFDNVLGSGCWKSTDGSPSIIAIAKNNVDRMTWNKTIFIKVRPANKNSNSVDKLLK